VARLFFNLFLFNIFSPPSSPLVVVSSYRAPLITPTPAAEFNEGELKTPNRGLTYFDFNHSTCWRTRSTTANPVLFSDGLKLISRNGENTTGCGDTEHCPNQCCAPGAGPDSTAFAALPKTRPAGINSGKGDPSAFYNTAVFTYGWPKATETQQIRRRHQKNNGPSPVDTAGTFLGELGRAGLLARPGCLPQRRGSGWPQRSQSASPD